MGDPLRIPEMHHGEAEKSGVQQLLGPKVGPERGWTPWEGMKAVGRRTVRRGKQKTVGERESGAHSRTPTLEVVRVHFLLLRPRTLGTAHSNPINLAVVKWIM